MTYKEAGFRAFYRRFTVFRLVNDLKECVQDFPEAERATHVLTYGYIDRSAGLTLEVLAAGIRTKQGFRFFDGNDTVRSFIRIDAVEKRPFFPYEDGDGQTAARYSGKLDSLKHYDASEEVEETRGFTFLDSLRDSACIDDVLVRIMKEGLKPEGCWVRITGIGDHCLIGTLLNEPWQDFGCHSDDTISFYVTETEDHEIICYSDGTPE